MHHPVQCHTVYNFSLKILECANVNANIMIFIQWSITFVHDLHVVHARERLAKIFILTLSIVIIKRDHSLWKYD